MTLRGYIKPVGGHMRMRFVQPGYDADDYDTPPNKVIFDSDDIGTLSLFDSGVYRLNRDGSDPVTKKIASWDLSYVPFCMFQSRPYSHDHWGNLFVLQGGFGTGASLPAQRITISKTGITVVMIPTASYIDIAWQAYRLVAAT